MVMETIKIFLSDPQVLFREGMHFTLSGEEDFEVIGESTGNEEAFTEIASNPPNIAVLSFRDSKMDGPVTTQRIKRNFPSILVVLVLEKDNAEQIFIAMKSGAVACINKDIDPDYLLELLRVISQGSQPIIDSLLMPELAAMVLKYFQDLVELDEQLENMLAHLSPGEVGTLGCIADGNNLEQCITKLNTTEGTIRGQLRGIVSKLVANEQARSLILVSQRGMNSLLSGSPIGVKLAEYVTKQEFNEFKEQLMERLKS
jgi:DNA-binding NarL/FixJ family response regulator